MSEAIYLNNSDLQPNLENSYFRPLSWCIHRWEDLTFPIGQDESVLGQCIKRICLAVPLMLMTVAACAVAVLGFLTFHWSVTCNSKLEVKYLNHETLLFLLKKLYPQYVAVGLCRGYSATAKDDLLEGSSSFRTTLRKLDNLMGYLEGDDLIREIKKEEDLTGFFKKIHTNYYKQKTDKLVGVVSGTYTNPQDLLPLMLSFQEQLTSSSIPFKALVFWIGSKDHAIVFGFNQEENLYRVIDANDLNSNIVPLDGISRQIASSYNLPKKSNSFYVQVFLSTEKENESDSKKIFDAWKASVLSNQIQKLSSLSEEEKSNWLYHAAYSNDEQSVLLLVQAGVNVKQPGKNGFTPLHVACQNGHEKVVRIILDKVDNVDHANENGFTPLHAACQEGHKEVAKILIDRGADVNQADNDGVTSFLLACQNGHEEVVELLVDKVDNVNQADNEEVTPFFLACQNGHEGIVQLLIDKVDNVNQADNEGVTPFFLACQNGHEGIVQLLIDKVDNVDHPNKKGFTPLQAACKNGHEGIVQLLIDRGADVNKPNQRGLTPLHFASQYGHKGIVTLLIENKADVNRQNKAGARPLSFARYMKHKEIEKILLAAGGKN